MMASLHFSQPAFKNIYNKSKYFGLLSKSSSRFKVFPLNNNVHSSMIHFTGLSRSASRLLTTRTILHHGPASSTISGNSVGQHPMRSRVAVQLRASIFGGQNVEKNVVPILNGCFRNTFQHKHSFSTSCATLATRKAKKRRQELEVLPFEVDVNNVTQDIPVYTNDGQNRFFLLVSFFGVIQFGFWSYVAHFAYTTLRDAPVKEEQDEETLPFWRKVNLGGNKYRFGTALLSITVGYVLLYASIFYPMRAVKRLTLMRGGRTAKVTTYAPFGAYRSFTARVEDIQSMQSRAEMKQHISLKVKNRRMFYLLDSNGKFLNTQIFDFIVGLKRRW
ncbi:transmembrane protein 223-like [Lineus longissimus]|uniref:transmembrane protein 223-like n=1 Tax=Lineus longissimus TaxID=88925 RepID=UPI002B4D56E5